MKVKYKINFRKTITKEINYQQAFLIRNTQGTSLGKIKEIQVNKYKDRNEKEEPLKEYILAVFEVSNMYTMK